MQLKVIIQHLKEEGVADVEGASSGQSALQMLRAYQPDLIISSLYLPDMTATELVIKLKETEGLCDIPFMLISSETRFSALNPIRQAGVVAILPKPFNHQDLRRALRTTLEFIEPEEIVLENYNVDALRVLVVDDSSMSRKHVMRTFNNLGINSITTATNGKEALELFCQDQDAFDLIVTDLNMPEMDGQELIETIRTRMQNPFIPILMVTSENDETRLNNVQQAGVSAIFDKPFAPENIKAMLFQIFDDQ